MSMRLLLMMILVREGNGIIKSFTITGNAVKDVEIDMDMLLYV